MFHKLIQRKHTVVRRYVDVIVLNWREDWSGESKNLGKLIFQKGYNITSQTGTSSTTDWMKNKEWLRRVTLFDCPIYSLNDSVMILFSIMMKSMCPVVTRPWHIVNDVIEKLSNITFLYLIGHSLLHIDHDSPCF